MKKLIPILLALLILSGCAFLPEASSSYPSLSLLPSHSSSVVLFFELQNDQRFKRQKVFWRFQRTFSP